MRVSFLVQLQALLADWFSSLSVPFLDCLFKEHMEVIRIMEELGVYSGRKT